jgi:class 3 adenylate cyclase
MERKLTAILCADVYGYSRLMGEDEEATLSTLRSHRNRIDSQIEHHHGRFVNSAGDSVLAEFASVVEAVNCAVDIQRSLKTENTNLSTERRMEFRIGVNLGDVMIDGEQIYGDGVNVAARLEGFADPGDICISGKVRDEVGNKLPLVYEDLGKQTLKNISKPVHVFRVLWDPNFTHELRGRKYKSATRKYLRTGGFSGLTIGLIVGVIVLVQHLSLRPLAPSAANTTPDSSPPPVVRHSGEIPAVNGYTSQGQALATWISSVTFGGGSGNFAVTVAGIGFGPAPVSMPCLSCDTSNFRIADAAQLGHGEWGFRGDALGLNYKLWTDNQIVVTGFGGASGDAIAVTLWNPVSGRGATWGGNVPPVPVGTPTIHSVQFSGSGRDLTSKREKISC